MKQSFRTLSFVALMMACSITAPFNAQAWEVGPDASPSRLFSEMALPGAGMDTSVAMPLAAEKKTASRGMDMGSAHMVMGYGTLALALGAAVSSSNEDAHEALGYAAATAATLTCVSGFLEYSDYFDTEEGLSPYNVHIVTGVVATAGFIITAILGADGEKHGGIGAGSAVLMCVPIISLKW